MSRPVSEESRIGIVEELRKINIDPCYISKRRASLADVDKKRRAHLADEHHFLT
jgi:hypothetical protein